MFSKTLLGESGSFAELYVIDSPLRDHTTGIANHLYQVFEYAFKKMSSEKVDHILDHTFFFGNMTLKVHTTCAVIETPPTITLSSVLLVFFCLHGNWQV
jgi:hypothetical protein